MLTFLSRMMKAGVSGLLLFMFVLPALTGQNTEMTDLQRRLYELPDVIFQALPADATFSERYLLRIRQPIDHQHPDKGYFYQRVVLSHQGFDRPMLMNTNGYALGGGPTELVDMLKANYLNVEHRYFGESKPDPLDWQYLTLEQVTADLHHINQLFRQVYGDSPWVSSGISKGGQTTLYYRYFYPDDVEASVTFVAPLNRSLEDPRIYAFLDTVGPAGCRTAIETFQTAILKQKKDALLRLDWYTKAKEMSFDYIGGLERAFEFAVLEYPFSFWQYGHDCNGIPDAKAPVDDLVDHLIAVDGLDFWSDAQIDYYAPHYYQAATQMGYYGYQTEEFRKYLNKLSGEPSAAFAPRGTQPTFSPALNEKVIEWVKTKAERMAFIYGGIDTWSATGADIGSNSKVKKYVIPGAHHGNARVVNMPPAMQKDFIAELAGWLGRQVKE